MYLIFDCSGSEKVKDYKIPFSNYFSWPKVVHLSWIVLNSEFKPVEDFDCILTGEGRTISEDAAKFAKIDPEDIEKKGIDVEKALEAFNKSVEKSEYIFAHNLNSNENILAAEFMRNTMDIPMFKKERFCLMQEGTYFCKLPSKTGGYKWPTLPELHAACFHTTYTPANNARADVIAAARCFIKLMKSGKLEDLFED